FFRGEVDKYTWVDIGSSFLPSDINAAILRAQFEHLDQIQKKRTSIFDFYYKALKPLHDSGMIRLPIIPDNCSSNAHMFYILAKDMEERTRLISHLKESGILAVFHYVPLHSSEFARSQFGNIKLPVTEELSQRLVRLPMYYDLEMKEVDAVIHAINSFYN
ncbi:MAG: DegT/DnrJ/EryC1/StrS family aminotransferase, partial [Balneolaceae bacterium]